MPKKKTEETEHPVLMGRPALSPDARELQVASLAIDLAEKQIREGTASSQVITHFLKVASSKERLEKAILEKQDKLIDAKTQALNAQRKYDELVANALDVFKMYSGYADDEEEFEDE